MQLDKRRAEYWRVLILPSDTREDLPASSPFAGRSPYGCERGGA